MSELKPGRRDGRGLPIVAAAAALWGTDALFRRGLALDLPASSVVLYEHLILAVLLAPALRGIRTWGRRLSPTDWVVVAVIGVGASAVATALFTAAFAYGDPTTPLLLQKLQPLFAVGAAAAILRERVRPRFGAYLVAGLAGAYLIGVPDPADISVATVQPALLAVGAAALWALGTVLGRYLTGSGLLETRQITALRFAIGLPAAAVIVFVQHGTSGFTVVGRADVPALVLLALIPGLAAMTLYYTGLRTTPASAATLAELAFPVTAVVIGRFVFDDALTVTQWVGLALLTGTIVTMSLRSRRRGAAALGVRTPVERVPVGAFQARSSSS